MLELGLVWLDFLLEIEAMQLVKLVVPDGAFI